MKSTEQKKPHDLPGWRPRGGRLRSNLGFGNQLVEETDHRVFAVVLPAGLPDVVDVLDSILDRWGKERIAAIFKFE